MGRPSDANIKAARRWSPGEGDKLALVVIALTAERASIQFKKMAWSFKSRKHTDSGFLPTRWSTMLSE
jgi:hypothetical protein